MKPVMIFTASWCGPCKMYKPMVQTLAKEGEYDFTFLDVEQVPDLAAFYGIRNVPSTVVHDSPESFRVKPGAMTRPNLINFIEGFNQ